MHSHSVRAASTLAGAAALLMLSNGPVTRAQYFTAWEPAVSVDPLRINGINTTVNDGCPIEGPDGHVLFFASNRTGNLDIWTASRTSEDAAWSEAEPLPPPVNSPDSDFCPTPLPANRLLFVSTRSNNCGGAGNNPDIYYTRHHPKWGWLPPEPLSCAVNSGFEEFSPSLVEAEGATMLFFSSNRSGLHKIYMSVLQSDGQWSPATAVTELNWPGAQDARPNVRKDGLEIVFDSTRVAGQFDIYTATRSSILEPWSAVVPIGPVVNDPTASETRASISRDGNRLYFGSTRANQPGDSGADIFVSTRVGPGKR
jgi:Tol biopolymer transport system component